MNGVQRGQMGADWRPSRAAQRAAAKKNEAAHQLPHKGREEAIQISHIWVQASGALIPNQDEST